MKAVTWQGRRDMRVEDVPDPILKEPTDAIVRVTSTGLCGSDLHLYETLGPFMTPGDVVGHEGMGLVEEVGGQVTRLKPGDRVVVPFNISCGSCWMCARKLFSQCETTQNREFGTGGSLFGYSKLYGAVPGAQAEYLRVPFADTLPIQVPDGPPDERFLFLSDVLPTAWQGVEYAAVPEGGTLLVLGLGPIGHMACRIARHRGIRTLGVERVPERIEAVCRLGIEVIDLERMADVPPGGVDDVVDAVLTLTEGRGADSVLDAVGMEAHGSPVTELVQKATGRLPSAVAAPLMRRAGRDRLAALRTAIECVRRGGTISVSGVYGGAADPLNLMMLFDKQVTVRMGQANVRAWSDDILPLLTDDDPLGTEGFATHRLPLSEAPRAYESFQRKEDGMLKVVFQP